MTRFLLKLETAITAPFFFASWMVFGVWNALVAGKKMAELGSEEKAEILQAMKGGQ